MNSLYFNVYELGRRYVDPITKQLSYYMIDKLGVKDYFGESYFFHNSRTAVSVNNDEHGNMRMGDRRVDVDVDIHLNPDVGQIWNRTTTGNRLVYGTSPRWAHAYEKLWCDPTISACIIEHTVPYSVILNFTLTFKDYDRAQMCLDRLSMMSCNNLITQVQDITYTYPMDFDIITILYQIYQRRVSENKDLNFYQYVNKYMCTDLVLEANKYTLTQNKQPDTAPYFRKYQLRCVGRIRCDQDQSETEREGKAPNAYLVKFTYEFQAGRPQILQFGVPIVVEQTPMPNTIFKQKNKGWFPQITCAFQDLTFSEFITHTLDKEWSTSMCTYQTPVYDEWVIPGNEPLLQYKYHPLFIGVVVIDEGSNEGKINFLTDLAPYSLHPKIIEFLKMHSPTEIFQLCGLFNLSVFIDGVKLDPEYYTYNPMTLDFTFLADRKEHIYRVVLSEAMDIKLVKRKFFNLILKNRYFFPMTIFQNLNYLCQIGEYCVSSDGKLVTLLKELDGKGLLKNYLARLVKEGYASGYIFQFTQTIYQLADYLCNTQAKFNPNVTLENEIFQSSLFTVLMNILEADGIISPDQRPPEYLRLPKGWPYGPSAGGWYNFNTPLRIQDTTLMLEN